MDWKNETVERLRAELCDLQERLAELEAASLRPLDVEAALEDGDSGILLLTESLRDVFWLTDWDRNRVLYVSPAYERVWGRTRQSLYDDPRSWADNIHPDDRDLAVRSFRAEAELGRYDVEYRVVHADGSVHWIHDRAFPLRDEHGRVRQVAGVSEDVTERKLAQHTHRRVLQRLQRRQDAVVRITTHPAVVAGDVEQAARLIAEAVTEILEVERVGVWLLTSGGAELECIELYERTADRHSRGPVLQARNYPRYFAAISTGRVIDTPDAQSDPRTSEFAAGYLVELGITSMMDAVIRVGGEAVGVVCHEHVGLPRTWRSDEIAFAGEVADQLAQALLNRDRARKEEELRETSERLAEAQQIAHLGSFELDPESGEAWYSDELFRLLGLLPDATEPGYAAFLEGVHPDDRESVRIALARAHDERQPVTVEFRYRRPDGAERTLQARARPRRTSGSSGVLGTCLDVTDTRDSERRQRLMVRELDHRVKNVLATVLAIARQTRQSAPDLDAFRDAFEGRIASMARVHEALSRRRWSGASLSELLRGLLEPYGAADGRRLELEGEELLLPYDAVMPLSAALHELVTNAAKYGALSVQEGRIRVAWEVRVATAARWLELRWSEHGGPPVQPPSRRGFGSTVIEQGVGYELDGRVELDWVPAGLRCTMSFALPERVLDGDAAATDEIAAPASAAPRAPRS